MDRKAGPYWRSATATVAALTLLAVILVISTRYGTVEVTSPDGKLPNDVQVVVSQGGEEIELLQADNQWSARIINGEYQVKLRGGDDRFEIKHAELVVKRMGQAAVTVTRKPTAEESRATVTTPEPNPSQPREWPPIAPAPKSILPDRELPFVVVNQAGEVRGEFRFITEVLSILREDEILEVRGNGPIKIPQIVRDKQALHIRAGDGRSRNGAPSGAATRIPNSTIPSCCGPKCGGDGVTAGRFSFEVGWAEALRVPPIHCSRGLRYL